jgi:hypothetical protein
MKLQIAEDGMLLIQCPACHCAHGFDGRWVWNGSEESPSLSPSMNIRWEAIVDGVEVVNICHSYVTAGRIRYLSDCTHSMAGQMVDLPDWDEV